MDATASFDASGASPADHRLAVELAGETGLLLVALRAKVGFADPAALGRSADRKAHELLAASLAAARPADAVLSEEGVDDQVRLTADRVWIVDPLDGTREFGEEGRSDWAVHVALWVGGSLAAGAVALPAVGQIYSTADVAALPAASGGPLRLAASRSRAPALVASVIGELAGTLVPMGSAGAKTMAVLRGQADAYLHAGGAYEWDSAAPVAVAAAAGLHTSRLDGSRLAYNQPNPYLPDLLVCRPELAERLLELIARLDGGGLARKVGE